MRAVGYWLQFLISSLFQAQSLSGGTFPRKSIGFHLMTLFWGPTLFSGHRRPRDGALKQQREPNCFIGYEGLLFSPINSALHQPFLCPPTTLVSPTKTFCTATIEKWPAFLGFVFSTTAPTMAHSFIPACIRFPPSSYPLWPPSKSWRSQFILNVSRPAGIQQKSYLLGHKRCRFW